MDVDPPDRGSGRVATLLRAPADLIGLLARLVAIAGCAFIVVITIADVSLRALFTRPILGSGELTASALAVLVGAGLVLCAGNDGHIRVTLFETALLRVVPERVHRAWIRLWEVGATAFLAYLLWRYAAHLFANYDYTPVLDYSLGSVFMVVAGLAGLAFVLLALRLLGAGSRS